MKITIKAHQPIYDAAKAKIRLTTSQGMTSEVVIDFEKLLSFANEVSDEVLDFFIIASIVYGVDRTILRRPNSVDGWSREMKVSFPVSNIQKWTPLAIDLQHTLSFLTGDYWDVEFRQSRFNFPSAESEYKEIVHQVSLFSGGLDSLIGAIDFLQSNPEKKLLLVSHYDSKMPGPKRDQDALVPKLEEHFSNRFLHVPSINVFPNSTARTETTSRSRSLLFIALALITAQAKEAPIIIPENGTVSLNFPLSSSRRSSCSTRTTHPSFINNLNKLLGKLNIDTDISNPYEFLSKGEMVKGCQDQPLLENLLSISNSCGKRGHRAHWKGNKSATHCGACMPCAYRQASLLSFKDTTTYGNTLNILYPFKTKIGQDMGACLEYLRTPLTFDNVKTELIIDGVKDLTNISQYVDVVLRTRTELKQWVEKVGNAMVRSKAGVE